MPSIEVLLLATPAITVLGFLLLPRKLRIAININIGRR
jgi:hypothetical protein